MKHFYVYYSYEEWGRGYSGFSEKIRSIVSGKKWYVNESGKTRQCRESPGADWQNGRKWNLNRVRIL